MGTPQVSVLMSVYNGLPYLEMAVNSILRQTFSDFEFIIVDDGSVDGTWDEILTYARLDTRIIPLRLQPNAGTSRALNKGLENAKGEFIARQDADDCSLPVRLKLQVDYLQSHPDVGLLATQTILVDNDGKPIEVGHILADGIDIHQALLDIMCLCGPTVMLRRSSFEAAGYYFADDLSYSEDYDLCLRLSEVANIQNLPTSTYYYRQHANSVSIKHRYRQMYNKALALERALNRRYGDAAPVELQGMVARDYLRAAYFGFASEDAEGAHRTLDRAVMFDPSLFETGTRVEEVFNRYLLNMQSDNSLVLAERLFDELLPHTRHLNTVRSRLISQLHMKEVFVSAEQDQRGQIGNHLWAGIRHDPRWLLNRGVVAVLLKSVFSRKTA